MNLFSILQELESNEDFHLGRILVLLNEFSKKNSEIEGLTKLAKLDFLLRYPIYLERALIAENKSSELAEIQDFERRSVEAKMVRFKYGPWDFRYRRFLNILIGQNLVYIKQVNRSYNIGLTENGISIAGLISNSEAYSDIAKRAIIVKRYFNISGTNLKKFIYKTFPEIITLKYGDQIK